MKLKKLHAFVMFALFLTPSFLSAQTADEIIAKHIKAHGGAEKWEQVNALKITGRFTAFSLEKDFTTYKTKCGAYYSDLYLGEQHVFEGFNGKCGWTIDPWQEIDFARNINTIETNVFKQKAEFFTPFLNYKEKGHQVEFVGKENVDGSEMYVLKLTRNDGKSEKWFLDAKTYLEYKCEASWVDFARPAPAEMYFDDFRNVDGIILPFFVERIFWQRDRITQIENVEINPKVDKSLFAMPKRKEISKLSFMQGDWNVKLEFVGRQGTYQERGTTESCIQFASTNLLQEKISYENYFPNTLSINFTYDATSKKYRIAAFNDFTSTFDMFQGDLNENTLIMEDTHISYSENKNANRTCRQFIYTKIDENQFTVENKISNDEGKNWIPQARLTYTRKTNENLSKK
ncbi:hypothetical protein [Marinifilum caeruleilacunae]|uniref:DUF1579 domain-containing protein n=1 Tax=Marinifilum caeruleilacunae TaxID=2499076 RepID=A0ABX1WXA0_9BACT|nr:hypothetical protein [Marinifilum caeruleilacunae]NOU60768.1 hypothetical protein [Marinifilum caeruleilacunae]